VFVLVNAEGVGKSQPRATPWETNDLKFKWNSERVREFNWYLEHFAATLSGLARNPGPATQGSALARATLGCRVVNAFGVSSRIAKTLGSSNHH